MLVWLLLNWTSCWINSRYGGHLTETTWIPFDNNTMDDLTHTKRCAITHIHAYIHYNDVIMSPMASQITSLTNVYSIVYSGANQRKHQSSASLAFVRGIHRWPVNSPHKGPVARKMFPFDDVIMNRSGCGILEGSAFLMYLLKSRVQ